MIPKTNNDIIRVAPLLKARFDYLMQELKHRDMNGESALPDRALIRHIIQQDTIKQNSLKTAEGLKKLGKKNKMRLWPGRNTNGKWERFWRRMVGLLTGK